MQERNRLPPVGRCDKWVFPTQSFHHQHISLNLLCTDDPTKRRLTSQGRISYIYGIITRWQDAAVLSHCNHQLNQYQLQHTPILNIEPTGCLQFDNDFKINQNHHSKACIWQCNGSGDEGKTAASYTTRFTSQAILNWILDVLASVIGVDRNYTQVIR